MNRWLTVPLGEVVTFQRGYDLPHQARKRGDIPIVTSAGVTDYHNAAMVEPPGVVTGRYGTRPIAYRMTGKCWVNNHAHILKAKPGFDQGFLLYSLVHKNILPFLASGTRAKLNKSAMNKIEVCPVTP